MRWMLAGCLGLGGCADLSEPIAPIAPEVDAPATPEPLSTGGDQAQGGVESACGATHYADMTISGVVIDASWQRVAGAAVWLEERDWGPTTVRGEGVSAADGTFLFEIEQVPIVEECWGIGPQFHIVAEDGLRIGEIPVNMQIVFAWLDGTLVADTDGLPCLIREPR